MDATLPQRQFTDAEARTWTLPALKRREFIAIVARTNDLLDDLAEEESEGQFARHFSMFATQREREARNVSEADYLLAMTELPQIEAADRAATNCYRWLIAGCTRV